MAPVALRLTLLSLVGNVVIFAQANEFLKPLRTVLTEHVSEEDVRISLLDEVENSLGKGSTSSRLSQMEATLRPIVSALPKNEYGKLGHSAVRYALHRLFVLRHGWVITGLGSGGGSWNSASPAGVLKDQVPQFIESLFEQRLAGKGFGLNEVAILAATIEHLIHNEAVSKLGAAFNVLSLPVIGQVAESEATEVLDTYMMAYILGENLNNLTLTESRELTAEMPQIFLAWGDTQKFVHDIRMNATSNQNVMDFASLAKVAEHVGEEFGSFQDLECRQLKDKLVNMEYRGTGRVKLADFYKPALDGAWTFQESAGYLRSQGILDDSDPNQPSVMIANYVTSHSNCIASSGFYSVCCKNECEGLLGFLEESIGASEATPESLATLVTSLPSSTVAVPQRLSSSLRQHLDDIAVNNGGQVPLHGRLFSQWMHHVYPRECPYPHMSGTTDAKLPDEFVFESGAESTASDEEMLQYIARSGNATNTHLLRDLPVEDLMPWSHEEELFVVRPQAQPVPSGPRRIHSIGLLAAAGSLAFGLIQTMKAPLGEPRAQKYSV